MAYPDYDAAPATAPIKQGMPTCVVAVVEEANFLGDETFISEAKQIERDANDLLLPVFSAGGIIERCQLLAARMAEKSGRDNVLYVADRYGVGNTGNVAVDAVAGTYEGVLTGEVSDTLVEVAADIRDSAKEAGIAVWRPIGDTLQVGQNVVRNLFIGAVILLVLYLLVKRS